MHTPRDRLPAYLTPLALAVGAVGLGAGAVAGGHQLLRLLARRRYLRRRAAERRLPRATPDGDALLVRNPIVETGQDPWVARVDDDADVPFHYVYSDEARTLLVKRSADLFDFDARAPYFRWDPRGDPATAHLRMLWAPELHEIDGQWVIYFAANRTSSLLAGTHRMHALVARDAADLTQGFSYAGELPLPGDRWAIDGTPFRHAGTLYHVWSGWRPGQRLHQYLYICAMRDALTPVGPAVEISAPTLPWELRGRRAGLWPKINEGPVQLSHGRRDYLIYSASGSWSDDYCLGLLELTGDDPLDAAAWAKYPHPVLERYGDVIAPGHCGFVERAGQTLCLYHAGKHGRAGWDREVHVTPVHWTADGQPVWGLPRREVALAHPGEISYGP